MKLFLALLLSSQGAAYTLTYKVQKPDAQAILDRVELATGMDFAAKCSSCTVHGHISTGGGKVVVEVYQAKAGNPRVIPTYSVTAALRTKIGNAVLGK